MFIRTIHLHGGKKEGKCVQGFSQLEPFDSYFKCSYLNLRENCTGFFTHRQESLLCIKMLMIA